MSQATTGQLGSAARGTGIKVLGLALSVALMACGGELPADEQPGQDTQTSESALTSCNAPVNGNADWIASTRTSSAWCLGCSFVTAEIRNSATNQQVLYSWAGIDQVTTRYYPGFCYGGTCYPARTVRTGIASSTGTYVAATLEGYVTFDLGSTRITVTPNWCGADSNGTTTIVGVGSDNVPYTVILTNTWFS